MPTITMTLQREDGPIYSVTAPAALVGLLDQFAAGRYLNAEHMTLSHIYDSLFLPVVNRSDPGEIGATYAAQLADLQQQIEAVNRQQYEARIAPYLPELHIAGVVTTLPELEAQLAQENA